MSDPVTPAAAAHAADYDPMAGWNDGFLGTGNSSLVEVAYIVGALVALYVVYATAKYFLEGTGWLSAIAEAVGLKED